MTKIRPHQIETRIYMRGGKYFADMENLPNQNPAKVTLWGETFSFYAVFYHTLLEEIFEEETSAKN